MKLGDRHKKNIYKVPDGYFDELPGKIQRKIETEKSRSILPDFNWSLALKIATPVIATVLLIFFVILQEPLGGETAASYEEILDEVSTDQMIAYLEFTDVSTDELLEVLDLKSFEGEFDDFDGGNLLDEDLNDAELDALMEEYNIDLEDI